MNYLVEIIYLAWKSDLKDTEQERTTGEALCDNKTEEAMLDDLLNAEREEAFAQGFKEAIRLLTD